LKAIDEAKTNHESKANIIKNNFEAKKKIKRESKTKQEKATGLLNIKPYNVSNLRIRYANYEFHEIPDHVLAEYLKKVVEIESPIHTEMLIHRCVNASGVKR